MEGGRKATTPTASSLADLAFITARADEDGRGGRGERVDGEAVGEGGPALRIKIRP